MRLSYLFCAGSAASTLAEKSESQSEPSSRLRSNSAELTARLDKIQLWFKSNDTTALTSDQLLEFVPPSLSLEPAWAYNRFSLERLIELAWNNWLTPYEPSPTFERTAQAAVTLFRRIAASSGISEQNIEFKTGEAYYYGLLGPQDPKLAFEHYLRAADAGHPAAQFMAGLGYATGLFGNVERDQARANLYYTFGALAGDPRAQMAIAYRHFYGIAMPVNFEEAKYYYGLAADQSMNYYRKLPTGIGFRNQPHNAWVIAEESDLGIYGPATSEQELSISPLRSFLSKFNSVEEGIEFLVLTAHEDNSLDSLKSLATIYHYGVNFGNPDDELAVNYARQIVDHNSRYQTHDGDRHEMWALAFIGDRYLRGEGVLFDPQRAREYYLRGIEVGRRIALSSGKIDKSTVDQSDQVYCAQCRTGLGMLAMHKFQSLSADDPSVHELLEEIKAHFSAGTKGTTGSAVSTFFLAQMAYEDGDYDTAITRLRASLRSVNPLVTYLLPQVYEAKELSARTEGDLMFPGEGELDRELASWYRRTAERIEEYHSPLRWAQATYLTDASSSLSAFLIAAEQGYHSAELNVADIVDVKHSGLSPRWLNEWPTASFVKERAETALVYFSRATTGRSRDALLKLGDYYYYGLGIEGPDYKRASECYLALTRHSGRSIAWWMLGYMYEQGHGVSRDFHLAKRYYDLALDGRLMPSAYLGVKLSLLKLHALSLVAWVRGEDVFNADGEDGADILSDFRNYGGTDPTGIRSLLLSFAGGIGKLLIGLLVIGIVALALRSLQVARRARAQVR